MTARRSRHSSAKSRPRSAPSASIAARRPSAATARTRCPAATGSPPAWFIPASTADVQAIVRAANKHMTCRSIRSAPARISGSAAARRRRAGQVVVDLGDRMNRILEIDEKLGFAVVEPGVSYQAMYDELVRRGNKLMLDVTSGPPQGGMLGNALDKGAGYTPYFDHFGFSCGMEVVLGNGEIDAHRRRRARPRRARELAHLEIQLRPDPRRAVHAIEFRHRHAHGRLAVAAAAGGAVVSLRLSRRRRSRGDHRAVPADEDVEFRADIVPAWRTISISAARKARARNTARAAARNRSRDEGRRALQREASASAPGRCRARSTGRAPAAIEPMIARVRDHFGKSGKARYISHEEAQSIPPLQVAINAFSGIPSLGELGLLKWRPGGGNIWFLPGTPMDGKLANEFQAIVPQDLRGSRPRLHGDECLRPAFRARAACHDIQPRGCRRAQTRGRLLSDNVGGSRQARGVRRPRAARLSRLAHGADDAGIPRHLFGDQAGARSEWRDRAGALRHRVNITRRVRAGIRNRLSSTEVERALVSPK